MAIRSTNKTGKTHRKTHITTEGYPEAPETCVHIPTNSSVLGHGGFYTECVNLIFKYCRTGSLEGRSWLPIGSRGGASGSPFVHRQSPPRISRVKRETHRAMRRLSMAFDSLQNVNFIETISIKLGYKDLLYKCSYLSDKF